MNFDLVLALILANVLHFTVGYCEENFDAVDNINQLTEEQNTVRNLSLGVIDTFSIDVESVVSWREIVNNMTLSKSDKKSAQHFLEYVRYTFKLDDELKQEMPYPNCERLTKFKTFYVNPGSLSEVELCNANIEIIHATTKTAEKRRNIEKYISNVAEKINETQEKVLDLKNKLTRFEINSLEESPKATEQAFKNLRIAAQDVLDVITSKRITKSLMIPMMDDIKEVSKIQNKLVKTLLKNCLTIN